MSEYKMLDRVPKKAKYRKVPDKKEYPTDIIICPDCGYKHNEWGVNMAWVVGRSKEKFRPCECPECIRKEKIKREKAKKERIESENKRLSEMLLKRLDIPEEKKKKALSYYGKGQRSKNKGFLEYQNLMDRIETANKKSKWILVSGVNLLGKTLYAIKTILRLSEKRVKTFYINEHKFFGELTEEFSKSSNNMSKMQLIKESDVLIWDEFGSIDLSKEKTQWKYNTILSIVEYFIDHNKTIVFLTNIGSSKKDMEVSDSDYVLNKLADGTGKKIISRLKDENRTHVIKLNMESYY